MIETRFKYPYPFYETKPQPAWNWTIGSSVLSSDDGYWMLFGSILAIWDENEETNSA